MMKTKTITNVSLLVAVDIIAVNLPDATDSLIYNNVPVGLCLCRPTCACLCLCAAWLSY